MQIIPLDLTVSERWFYFPIVGLLGMTGVVIESLKINKQNKKYIIALFTLIIILFSFRTFVRSFDWRNDTSIAQHDINVSGGAYNLELMISAAYYNNGMYKEAAIHAQKSVNSYPNVLSLNTLGLAYFNLGDYKRAKEAYLTSLQYAEIDATYENLSIIALSYGDPHKNIAFINKALQKYPHSSKLLLSLACLEYNYGDKKNAKDAIEKAYKLSQESQIKAVYQIIKANKPLDFIHPKNPDQL
jgi:tetratricopeptide (TPR) repeat protein